MNTRLLSLAALAALCAASSLARAEQAPEAPVPVSIAPAPQALQAPRAAEEPQRLYGPSNATIIPAEQAQALVSRFKEAYAKLGNPRIVFYINRELVDTSSGLKLTGRTERYENTKSDVKRETEKLAQPAQTGAAQTQINVAVGGNSGTTGSALPQGKSEGTSNTTKTSGENTYSLKDGEKAALSDRQTVRDVERLFGRVFRAGGALLADQKVAASLLEDKPIASLTGTSDAAAKDREALAKIADVAIEILISSRTITVPAVSGDQQTTVPDIQATAVRLSDAGIIAQASATDILGKDRNAGNLVQNFDVRDITEATALALMEDMIASAK